MRPAAEAHFGEIAEIINLESRQRTPPYALESRPVQVQYVRQIFEHSRHSLSPFIVACLEEEDLLDRSKWLEGGEKAYREYVKSRASQPVKPPVVVGFASVAEARIGLRNRPCPGSRFVGQIRLIIHPEHRRKQYGAALLDRILLSVAPYHRSMIGYKWNCDEPGLVYEQPSAAHNRRLYSRVLAETFSQEEHIQAWKRNSLEKFDFKNVGRLEEMVRTNRGRNGGSQWLDLDLWQLQTGTQITYDEPGKYLIPQ